MGFTLFMDFTGLCLFVPHPSGKRMRVLLVDVTNPHGAGASTPDHPHEHGNGGDGDAGQHEPHLPVLVYDVRDLAESRDDETFTRADEFGRMDLLGFDLEIAGAREDTLHLVDGPTGRCPRNATARNASWLAKLGDVGQRNARVHDSCLHPTAVSNAVATRIRLTEGEFSTRFLAASGGVRPLQYRFGPQNGELLPGQRAMAEIMELKLEIPGDTVTLEAKSFRSPGRADRIVLQPQTPTADVRIFVKNMPLLDITGDRPAEEVERLNERRSVDFHFAHFDLLLAQPAPRGQEPLPLAVDRCNYIQSEPPHLGNPQCPGGEADPDPQA